MLCVLLEQHDRLCSSRAPYWATIAWACILRNRGAKALPCRPASSEAEARRGAAQEAAASGEPPPPLPPSPATIPAGRRRAAGRDYHRARRAAAISRDRGGAKRSLRGAAQPPRAHTLAVPGPANCCNYYLQRQRGTSRSGTRGGGSESGQGPPSIAETPVPPYRRRMPGLGRRRRRRRNLPRKEALQ